MDIKKFWDAVLRQDANAIRQYFHSDAWVNWHNTNEHFTVEEFIRANCEYPGEWGGEVERIIATETHIITAAHVFSKDKLLSFHVTSFVHVVDGKIASVEEWYLHQIDVQIQIKNRKGDLYLGEQKVLHHGILRPPRDQGQRNRQGMCQSAS